MGNFLPNSYQTPNIYIDRILPLLKPTEWVVLSFAVRHIMGWQDKITSRRSHISLSRFGECGLSKPAVIKALGELERFCLLKKVGEPTSRGQLWELIIDDETIKFNEMETRADKTARKDSARTRKARKKLARERNGGQSDLPPNEGQEGVSETDRGLVGLTGSGQSDLPPGEGREGVSGTDRVLTGLTGSGQSDLPPNESREGVSETDRGLVGLTDSGQSDLPEAVSGTNPYKHNIKDNSQNQESIAANAEASAGPGAPATESADAVGDTLGQGQNAEDRTPSQNPTPPGSATAPSPRDLLARPIREVKAAVKAGEVADLSALLERERDGKARKTLIAWLEARADTFPAAVTEPMREAIRAAFGWEVEHMTDNEHGQVATAAKGLLKAGYAPDHVATIYAHCAAQGWSGGFGPTALLNHASAALAAGKAKPNGKPQNGAGLRAYLAEYADEIASRETAVDWS